MKKLKIFGFAAMCATMLIACSEEDDDGRGQRRTSTGNGVCYWDLEQIPPQYRKEQFKNGVDIQLCLYSISTNPKEYVTPAVCEQLSSQFSRSFMVPITITMEYRNSCPPNYVLECGQGIEYVYLYGSDVTGEGITCENFY